MLEESADNIALYAPFCVMWARIEESARESRLRTLSISRARMRDDDRRQAIMMRTSNKDEGRRMKAGDECKV